jgi:hypothetical protein
MRVGVRVGVKVWVGFGERLARKQREGSLEATGKAC